MKNKSIAGIAGVAGVTLGMLLGPLSPAQAGHANALLETELNGRNEVGSAKNKRNVGDPNGRGEAYVFGIDGDPNTLCYIIQVDKIAELGQAPGGPRMAHIHEGAAGTNGPVVANLAFPQNGTAADCLTEGEAGKFAIDPATGMPFTTVAEILANPQDYYVNVHNAEFPGGAIRGQLMPQSD